MKLDKAFMKRDLVRIWSASRIDRSPDRLSGGGALQQLLDFIITQLVEEPYSVFDLSVQDKWR
jgi:hypothetical protein